MLGPVLAIGLFAGATSIMWLRERAGAATRYASSVALVGCAATLLFQLAGHPWQVDLHMYFFACLAVLAAWCDWRALLLAAASIALHHLVLNFALPVAVFPGGADLGRAEALGNAREHELGKPRRARCRRQRRRDLRTATSRGAEQNGEHEDLRHSAIHCTTADGNRSRIRRGTSASIETRPSVET